MQFFLLCSISCNAVADYQFEISASQFLSKLDKQQEEQTSAIKAIFYTSPVEDSTATLGQADFLAKSSYLSISYQTKTDSNDALQ